MSPRPESAPAAFPFRSGRSRPRVLRGRSEPAGGCRNSDALPLLRFLIHALALGLAPGTALAVTRTWDGGALTGNWTDPLNWSGDLVPGVNDVALFNGTSSKSAAVNAAVNVLGIRIDPGYTGTISQSPGSSITVGASGIVQAGGVFSGGNSTAAHRGPGVVV